MAEFHVDTLGKKKEKGADGEESPDLFAGARTAMGPEGGYRSARFEEAAAAPCRFQHDPVVCKCALPVYHMGQDECIYKAYLCEGMEWVTQGVRAMRKKTDGPGEMVSGFQDEIRGFGFAMSDTELAAYNQNRLGRNLPPLDRSPGLRFLLYGKNKEGWWDHEMFSAQCTDIIDAFEFLYPAWQLAQEVDHSSGHGKYKADGLLVLAMNKGYGGKQRGMRDTVVDDKCLGNEPAIIKWTDENGVEHVRDCKLKPGDKQSFTFKADDPPPFYFPTAPQLDRAETVQRPTKKKAAAAAAAAAGEEPPTSGYGVTKLVEGYVGKAKGKQQILWERGLWRTGMTVENEKDPTLSIHIVNRHRPWCLPRLSGRKNGPSSAL
jgi:hypothetical protein